MDFFKLFLELCLSHFHLILNDWRLAIVALALCVRVILFPIQAFNFIQQRRMRGIQPEVDQLRTKYKQTPLLGLMEIQELKNKNGIKTWTMMMLSFVQIPIFLGMYQAISSARNLSNVSFVWISSLATPDALYILPLLVAIATYFQFKSNLPSTNEGKTQAELMTKILPIVNFIFMSAMPSALVLYYATSGIFQVASETALRKILT